jgi:hypothetical protein
MATDVTAIGCRFGDMRFVVAPGSITTRLSASRNCSSTFSVPPALPKTAKRRRHSHSLGLRSVYSAFYRRHAERSRGDRS